MRRVLGRIFGSGVAASCWLGAALEDGDHIYAVIKGSAVNERRRRAKSATPPPSAVGQARAVIEALEAAQVPRRTASAMWNATPPALPPATPVEIQALTASLSLSTLTATEFCAVGSVKTNIGHPEQSAGFAGLIKTALALHHGEIPPTVHFTTPIPAIPFSEQPVRTVQATWATGLEETRFAVPRCSLGIGGTNAFLVLEEAPEPAPRAAVEDAGDSPDRRVSDQLFCISARTPQGLRSQAQRFLRYLDTSDGPGLEDICHTFNPSPTAHSFRFAAACSTKQDLEASLRLLASRAVGRHLCRQGPRCAGIPLRRSGHAIPGYVRGFVSHHAAVSRRHGPVRCRAPTAPETSLVELLIAREDPAGLLNQTRFTQPALFAVEYALAELWRSWGLVPRAVMGHSVGELVAACVAGVL